MGKLLFPRGEVEAWLAAHSSGARAEADRSAKPAPTVFLGSHDPVLEWALREAQSGIAAYFDSSADGLARMLAGEGVATGLHLYDPETGEWNRGIVARECAGRPFALIGWARRRRGLIFAGDFGRRLETLSDVRGLRLASRQPEAGSQRIFEHLADKAGLGAEDYEIATVARSEADAALAVLEGRADVCFGLEALARQYRLGFAPAIEEEFDLLVDRRAWFEPPMQAFVAFWRSDEFLRHAEAAAGYDFSTLGQVRWNGP